MNKTTTELATTAIAALASGEEGQHARENIEDLAAV
jgi:hypothetical protein